MQQSARNVQILEQKSGYFVFRATHRHGVAVRCLSEDVKRLILEPKAFRLSLGLNFAFSLLNIA